MVQLNGRLGDWDVLVPPMSPGDEAFFLALHQMIEWIWGVECVLNLSEVKHYELSRTGTSVAYI